MKKTVVAFVLAGLASAVFAQQPLKPEEMIKYRKAGYSFMSWNMGKIKANLDGTFNKEQVIAAANVIAGTANSGMGALFGPGTENADAGAFAERCQDDRHHFRFIVSPDDAVEMTDLKSFTRDLVGQMEKDLGTRLDWVAVDHWNTEHPHVHLIVRGVRDDGQDLVIARDYIKEGMRDRARDLITQELGPRTDLDIRRALELQIDLLALQAQDLRAAGGADLA